MDTDDLSNETSAAVLTTSEKFNEDLTLQFGLLAEECNDDNDYLMKAKSLILEWRKDLDYASECIFFEEQKPSNHNFENVLEQIEKEIDKVFEIPIEKRKFGF